MRSYVHLGAVGCVLAVVIGGCRGGSSTPPVDAHSNPEPGSSSGPTPQPKTVKAPEQHRSGATACDSTPPPPGNANPKAEGCKSDADCKQGKNARCKYFPGGHELPHNYCEYSTCFTDADCAASGAKVCSCDGSREVRSACLAGNCRVDSDCPAGYCSPSYAEDPMGACGGYRGYYCRTASDTCVENADCHDGQTCTYQALLGHWACVANRSCPVG